TAANRIELWLGDPATGKTAAAKGLALNTALGTAPLWMPDGRTLLCLAVPPGRGKAPEAPRVPKGPTIQESSGKPSPVRTFQDLLQNAHDEDLFDYYATSQIVLHDAATGKTRPVGGPGVLAAVSPSPDGRFLLVTRLKRPYSYLQPMMAFPREIEVWDLEGRKVHTAASVPLADQVPIEGVRTGPRQIHWRPGEPATLVWAEALDGGDPPKAARHPGGRRQR